MTFDPRQTGTLAVLLHGRKIGVINRLAGDQFLFAFVEDYIEDEARPTLSLSFKSAQGALNTSVRPVQTKLPPFFSNLLPEGQLRDYLARRAGVKPEREFFLLAALGSDLPGAVSVVPEEDSGQIREDGARPDETDFDHGAALRFSLAGIQLKFSAIQDATGGLTVPADGMGGAWILKLPSFRYPHVPENEFAMMELARRVGIAVPETKLVPFADIHGLPESSLLTDGMAFSTRRFDRLPNGNRLHMEDFAQVFGTYPQDKYDGHSCANIAFTLWTEAGEESAYEFVRRLVFTIMIGNADMHLKNWSLLYPDGRKPALSPAYDFVSTIPYLPEDKLALGFGGSRNLHEITTDQLRRFADTAHMPVRKVAKIAAETVDLTKQAWADLGQKELLPATLRGAIARQIDSVSILF